MLCGCFERKDNEKHVPILVGFSVYVPDEGGKWKKQRITVCNQNCYCGRWSVAGGQWPACTGRKPIISLDIVDP